MTDLLRPRRFEIRTSRSEFTCMSAAGFSLSGNYAIFVDSDGVNIAAFHEPVAIKEVQKK